MVLVIDFSSRNGNRTCAAVALKILLRRIAQQVGPACWRLLSVGQSVQGRPAFLRAGIRTEAARLLDQVEGLNLSDNAQQLRELIEECIHHITLHFEPVQNGERRIYRLLRGELAFCKQPGRLSLKENRGDWRSFEPAAQAIAPFMAPLLGPPEPFILLAAGLARRAA